VDESIIVNGDKEGFMDRFPIYLLDIASTARDPITSTDVPSVRSPAGI
jgi:hypothetical protein